MERTWKAIAAMAENRVIGAGGTIPWHLPEDFKWVKACTQGQTIVMGRRTWESLGRPLPKRRNVVVSRSLRAEDVPSGVVLLSSLDGVDQLEPSGDVWIFGGAEIYRAALPRIREFYLTLVHQKPAGDTYLPPFEAEFSAPEIVREGEGFTILRYQAP